MTWTEEIPGAALQAAGPGPRGSPVVTDRAESSLRERPQVTEPL